MAVEVFLAQAQHFLEPRVVGTHRRIGSGAIKLLLESGSPLAEWTNAFLSSTFRKMELLHHGAEGPMVGLSMHDPLCVWYV